MASVRFDDVYQINLFITKKQIMKTIQKKTPGVRIVILPILFLLFMNLDTFAQERWQADMSVTSISIIPAPVIKKPANIRSGQPVITETPALKTTAPIDANLKCSITLHNENDDDAWGTMLVVTLPVEVTVVSMPSNAKADPSVTATQPIAGHLIFTIGHMAVGQNVTVEFTFTKSKYGNKVGAFAYSDSPDPNPANNYKDAAY
jgi:hypothetical protein